MIKLLDGSRSAVNDGYCSAPLCLSIREKKKPIGLFCESFSYLLQKQRGKPQIDCEVKKKTKRRKHEKQIVTNKYFIILSFLLFFK